MISFLDLIVKDNYCYPNMNKETVFINDLLQHFIKLYILLDSYLLSFIEQLIFGIILLQALHICNV